MGAMPACVTPSKILCIGRNYADHARERGAAVPAEPLVFLKPPSALVGPHEAIVLPSGVGRVDYEGEIALVVGERARNLPEAEAMRAIRGVTIANDVSARALQERDGQWARAKGFDTFCPVGPVVAPLADVPWEAGLKLETWVNGELRQTGHTRDLTFGFPFLVSYLSRVMTLMPDDLILTGTPAGVGPLAAGDFVAIRVTGVGTLESPVVGEF